LVKQVVFCYNKRIEQGERSGRGRGLKKGTKLVLTWDEMDGSVRYICKTSPIFLGEKAKFFFTFLLLLKALNAGTVHLQNEGQTTFFIAVVFETGSELAILLHQPPKCWDNGVCHHSQIHAAVFLVVRKVSNM
jgi:hypothetical protein